MNTDNTADAERPHRPLLLGCGILRDEVEFLIHKNNWNIETRFLESSLHNHLGKLERSLENALARGELEERKPLVFYGACHPLMDKIIENHGTVRTPGQNCIVMLLGYERFMRELGDGAYFLLAEWARKWRPMLIASFGPRADIIREIFAASHSHILAIRTPCSGDFDAAAREAAEFVNLPLRWMDADLEELESVLRQTIAAAEGLR